MVSQIFRIRRKKTYRKPPTTPQCYTNNQIDRAIDPNYNEKLEVLKKFCLIKNAFYLKKQKTPKVNMMLLSSLMPSAEITNGITNALHASILFVYFILSVVFYFNSPSRTDPALSLSNIQSNVKNHFHDYLIILLFFLLFIAKVLGAYIHYFYLPYIPGILSVNDVIWMVIGGLAFAINVVAMRITRVPIALFCVLTLFNAILNGSFIYQMYVGLYPSFAFLGIGMIVSFLVSSYFSRGFVRWGFLCSVISNATWILLHANAPFCPNHLENSSCNYENDIFHFMLIGSTFLIFLGIYRGDLDPLKSKKVI